MYTAIQLALLLVVGAVHANIGRMNQPPTKVTSTDAKAKLYEEFIKNVYQEAADLQVNNIYNMLQLYTHSTLEQTHQVIDYIQQHANATRSESLTLRMASNASFEIAGCVHRGELSLLQAFRTTGYNLHNCIRTAQLGFEKSFVEINGKLDPVKAKAMEGYRHYSALLDNCVEEDCSTKVLVAAALRYALLKSELEKEKMEGHNLNSRYLVNSIAMGCISNSLQQIHHNFNVGKEMMARCFHVTQVENQNKYGAKAGEDRQPSQNRI